MRDLLQRLDSGKLWRFPGGIHPREMKSQSNGKRIARIALAKDFYIPLKQHIGESATLCVAVGEHVLKGQKLTEHSDFRHVPVHAPTSGYIRAIAPFPANHPSGLSETMIHVEADGEDKWTALEPCSDYLSLPPQTLVEKIHHAGIAGLGGAVFPTARKIEAVLSGIEALIINGAECEPYITCDDRLMQDYTAEMIEGVRILRYLTRAQKVVIAIEDNKPRAIAAVKKALKGANDIILRVIPTIYPSGASKQLIQILTGLEVPHGARSSQLGILMHNTGTAYAIKRAVIDGEPMIERVVTLTGDKIPQPRNYWLRFGTPIRHVLSQAGYQADPRLPIFVGGPMMGYILPNLAAPITKLSNCIIAPDHFEYQAQAPEQGCIRCSSCSDACPVQLLPQQLYWFARNEEHDKSTQYNLSACIECGVCAYVCPSHIPLIQYFRQEKAKIAEIKEKERLAEEAKVRFEAREARLLKEKQAREARAKAAAEKRRQEVANQQGEDPVKAALERLKAKKAQATPQATVQGQNGEVLPDNSELMAQRKARRLQKAQAASEQSAVSQESDPRKAAVAAALARAKAKQAEKTQSAVEPQAEIDPRKAAVAAAIARAKAKQAEKTESAVEPQENDPCKAAVAAAIARAKAKQAEKTESAVEPQAESDPKKAAVKAAIARAKAKQAEKTQSAVEPQAESDPKKTAVKAAIARAKAKQAEKTQSAVAPKEEIDPKKAAVKAAIARAKAKQAAKAENNSKEGD
ncbi:electron transport complex subunit RsxC [Pasteurellaceae bacterium 20609_3]|uniref:electron transport complex subunit RsxC n=1 Tax=Spirabiliibacterium mucosae TaxID=28156 RepID=UPI001AAC6634|nr:electron transport complex subunit RsxC [Spirabiliibacterium mucosae]MBE2897757.1 electron transport complex subunit RsxC [Spirabiliibacterium mucosae]